MELVALAIAAAALALSAQPLIGRPDAPRFVGWAALAAALALACYVAGKVVL